MSYGPPRVLGHPMPGEPLTQETVRRLFDYDPETGDLTWKTSYRRFIGKRAGFISNNRLRVIIARKKYIASRIIWMHVFGSFPDVLIDHIDGDSLNNRLSNLRLATYGQNNANKARPKHNKSGYKGVSFDKRYGLWRATIGRNYRSISLGYYATPEEAYRAYCSAAQDLHGEYARLEQPLTA